MSGLSKQDREELQSLIEEHLSAAEFRHRTALSAPYRAAVATVERILARHAQPTGLAADPEALAAPTWEPFAGPLVERRMAHYGYTPEQIKAAALQVDHYTAGCSLAGDFGWDCINEHGLSNHPASDEYDQTAEFVVWVLEELLASGILKPAAQVREEALAGIRAAFYREADPSSSGVIRDMCDLLDRLIAAVRGEQS